MIDIHSHILPGIDDGAKSLEEALEMAKTAVLQGIHTVIATPHHLNGLYETPAKLIKPIIDSLNDQLYIHNISLRIVEGQEIRVHAALVSELYQGNLCTLAGSRYMLLELPSRLVPRYLDDVLHELNVCGITPIIAHPERNYEILYSPSILNHLIDQGALCQVTAHSIIGHFGKRVQKLCIQLCKNKMVHFVASDAHHPFRRAFALVEAYRIIGRLLGDELVHIFKRNAQCVLNNELIVYEEQVAKKRRSVFW
ncbi:CpsB/CapC family capsule biosynthesis tyrosine phosphatase [Paenibacillus sediminis]|uniref:Tyrosine-protein phosphatase n=1 Tax=Paenibacillus sediminis TaxID=664909 RepID=A0ABS4H4A5_9BACL|nr:CpsB/CapC family capsule biosynthesis tyrosine phosphatase [Paenibacillus sediminis]MBP1937370.1 protein-tyrosine phosphatase [Paenibacillus sediminis]